MDYVKPRWKFWWGCVFFNFIANLTGLITDQMCFIDIAMLIMAAWTMSKQVEGSEEE